MKKIIKRMLQAKTKEELLTCEVDLQIQYNHLSEELLEDGAISEKDYEGIFTFYRSSRELLVDINEKAESLHKKFPRAIEILQLAILYYSREILNLLYSGYWDNLLVMKGKKKEWFVNLVEELEKSQMGLFLGLWRCFCFAVIGIWDYKKRSESRNRKRWTEYCTVLELDQPEEITIYNNDYEELLNHSLTSFGGSLFSQIVDGCLGQYIAYFTKIEYILNYQPIFVGAAFTLLKNIVEEKEKIAENGGTKDVKH